METTPFTNIYNRFLNQITDDSYLEMTPQDTIKDLRNLLQESIPDFEFPRQNLSDYIIDQEWKPEDEVVDGDFIIGVAWEEIPDATPEIPNVLIEKSHFNTELTSEEMNILAKLMKIRWIGRQIASVENIRMKYSGSDFKFTSQANHISKLLGMQQDAKNDALHAQRLYKRRKTDNQGYIHSNWSVLREVSALDDDEI